MKTQTATGDLLETKLSHVDGEAGVLILRGHPVERLAARATFEDVVGLFVGLEAPDIGARPDDRIRRELAAGRRQGHELLGRVGDALQSSDAMEAVRTVVSHLPGAASAADIIGTIAVAGAAWWRTRNQLRPLPPDLEAGHAADLLRMIRGERPTQAEASALNAYLVTVVDHGMNASTFTARVVASTGSDRVSAVVAAIGALKGPLHGGAPGPVLDMLDAIGSTERAETWLRGELEAHRRIMGMGHRIYRVRDPRAEVLEQALRRLGLRSDRLELAAAVEACAERLLRDRHPDRPLRANVEFYTAVLLEAVGVPRELFTAIFAASRAAGWCAHFDEQQQTGRLIRPPSRYVGSMPVGAWRSIPAAGG